MKHKDIHPVFFTCLIPVILAMGACSHMPSKTDDAVWIDVRTDGEYRSGHLENAVNIPHTDIRERIVEVAGDRDTPIYLYCGSGRRSGIAREALIDMGYTNVINAGAYRDLVEEENN